MSMVPPWTNKAYPGANRRGSARPSRSAASRNGANNIEEAIEVASSTSEDEGLSPPFLSPKVRNSVMELETTELTDPTGLSVSFVTRDSTTDGGRGESQVGATEENPQEGTFFAGAMSKVPDRRNDEEGGPGGITGRVDPSSGTLPPSAGAANQGAAMEPGGADDGNLKMPACTDKEQGQGEDDVVLNEYGADDTEEFPWDEERPMLSSIDSTGSNVSECIEAMGPAVHEVANQVSKQGNPYDEEMRGYLSKEPADECLDIKDKLATEAHLGVSGRAVAADNAYEEFKIASTSVRRSLRKMQLMKEERETRDESRKVYVDNWKVNFTDPLEAKITEERNTDNAAFNLKRGKKVRSQEKELEEIIKEVKKRHASELSVFDDKRAEEVIGREERYNGRRAADQSELDGKLAIYDDYTEKNFKPKWQNTQKQHEEKQKEKDGSCLKAFGARKHALSHGKTANLVKDMGSHASEQFREDRRATKKMVVNDLRKEAKEIKFPGDPMSNDDVNIVAETTASIVTDMMVACSYHQKAKPFSKTGFDNLTRERLSTVESHEARELIVERVYILWRSSIYVKHENWDYEVLGPLIQRAACAFIRPPPAELSPAVDVE